MLDDLQWTTPQLQYIVSLLHELQVAKQCVTQLLDLLLEQGVITTGTTTHCYRGMHPPWISNPKCSQRLVRCHFRSQQWRTTIMMLVIWRRGRKKLVTISWNCHIVPVQQDGTWFGLPDGLAISNTFPLLTLSYWEKSVIRIITLASSSSWRSRSGCIKCHSQMGAVIE